MRILQDGGLFGPLLVNWDEFLESSKGVGRNDDSTSLITRTDA